MLEGGRWKGCENVRNNEFVIYSYEQRRMNATFKGGQDSCRANVDNDDYVKLSNEDLKT
jgi:hypothetical protein